MRYYTLSEGNAVGAWTTDRAMEFLAKPGYQDALNEIVRSLETLREKDVPIYTADRLVYLFGDASEISKEDYDRHVEGFKDLQAKSSEMAEEMSGMTEAEMQRYINNFPNELPGLVNRKQLSRLIWAFNEIEGLNDTETEAEDVDDKIQENIQAVYAILRHVEKTGDPSAVEKLLQAVDG